MPKKKTTRKPAKKRTKPKTKRQPKKAKNFLDNFTNRKSSSISFIPKTTKGKKPTNFLDNFTNTKPKRGFTFQRQKNPLDNFLNIKPTKRTKTKYKRPPSLLDQPTNPRKATSFLDKYQGGEQNAKGTFEHFQGKERGNFLDKFSERTLRLPAQQGQQPQTRLGQSTSGVSRKLASGVIGLARAGAIKGAQFVGSKLEQRRIAQQQQREIFIPETAGTDLTAEEIVQLQEQDENKPQGLIGKALEKAQQIKERRQFRKEAEQALQTYEGDE